MAFVLALSAINKLIVNFFFALSLVRRDINIQCVYDPPNPTFPDHDIPNDMARF